MIQSSFTRTMLSIAVPVTLQNLLFSSFTLIDTLMIGALGDTPLAAVGMAGKWTWFFTIVLFGFGSGASVFIAQYFGAGDTRGIHRTYGLLTGGSLFVSAAFMAAALVAPERIIRLFSSDPQAIALGADPITAIKAACHNAARYFLLNNRGAIAPGYLADFVIIDDFQHFNIEKVYKRGVLMVENGVVADFPLPEIDPYLVSRAHDTFHVASLSAEDFTDSRPHAVIGMVDGEITTTDGGYTDRIDVDYDILKIAVIERHKNTHHIGLGYIKGYGLKKGAVATSISHDSHNIIVVGTNEEDMAFAANHIVQEHGGITVVENGQVLGDLRLNIAGIMSDDTLVNVNRDLEAAKEQAYKLGVSKGIDPFMTLSFMALPVIPSLRITTRGVFDVTTQRYV